MHPVMVLVLLLTAKYSATLFEDNTGLNFIIVFPENIAFYYPFKAKNMVQITAMYDQTEITIKSPTEHIKADTLKRGESKDYEIKAKLELRRSEYSNDTVQISSNKIITVHAINRKESSMQTALVIPSDKLATKYLIPPVPKIQGTTVPAEIVTTNVSERCPFKLIIINGDKNNDVIVKGRIPKNINLQPNQIAQIWVIEDEGPQTVDATNPVAVLFGHACAMRDTCTCGQLYAMLPPAKEDELKFYVPPVLANNIGKGSFVLLSDQESAKVEAFNPDTPLVTVAGTAILYHPGLLLPLIPEKDFATCYVVTSIPGTKSSAVIIVHEDFTDKVHIRSLSLKNALWQKLKGTEYVSTVVELLPGKSVIWHASSKMAVYFVGTMESASFGNPAPIISKTADFRGCVLSPEIVKIGEIAAGWRESLKYCNDQGLKLVSFAEEQLQTQIYSKILLANNASVLEVWIGLRRSSHSGEWYWLSKVPVNNTNWEEGEPGTVHDGQCAIMSLEKNKDFGWRDEDCCKAAHPVCYKKPMFLPH